MLEQFAFLENLNRMIFQQNGLNNIGFDGKYYKTLKTYNYINKYNSYLIIYKNK